MTQSVNEAAILRSCLDWLHEQGYYLFWRNNNLAAPGRSLPKYTPKGLPDIFIVIDGRLWGVECKRPKGSDEQREKNGRVVRERKLSPQQAEFGIRMELAGARYVIAHSLEEMVRKIPKKA